MSNGPIPSYPKVYNLGHANLEPFVGKVYLQEKIDGSQLSWMWRDDGELVVKSKSKYQCGTAGSVTDPMFQGAVDYLSTVEPIKGYAFRGEWLSKPKHNTLAYNNTPKNGIALFDAEDLAHESRYIQGHNPLVDFALSMDIGFVDTISAYAEDLTKEWLDQLLSIESTLGGVTREGVVIKSYLQFTKDGKVAMAKYVSPAFQEAHRASWKTRNPNQKDFVEGLIEALNTEARWAKAVQHLRENGELTGTPKDIGALMVEVKRDTFDEEYDYIVDELVKHFAAKVKRGLGRGLPEWYKDQLAFGGDE